MKNLFLALALISTSSFSPLFADEEECPAGSEPFAGAVKEIKTGECKGKWGMETFIGDYYPTDLPYEYQAQYARVRGCFHVLSEKGCTVNGANYRAVSIDAIWPD